MMRSVTLGIWGCFLALGVVKTMKYLYLNDCDGVSQSAVNALKEAIPGIYISHHLNTVKYKTKKKVKR